MSTLPGSENSIWPQITHVTQKKKKQTLNITLELEKSPRRPFAPGGVFLKPVDQGEWGRPPLLEIHRFIKKTGNLYSFKSYNQNPVEIPRNDTLIYVNWWFGDELSFAHSNKSDWVRKLYPRENDHDHCCFCWKKIALYTEKDKEGYELVDEYWEEWMCLECFAKYIQSGLGKKLGDSDMTVKDWRMIGQEE